jgi:uroporphyrinogen-III synthase
LRKVIVTRALREAQVWARDLTAAGLNAEIFPLIEIRPVADSSALRQVWNDMANFKAVMFVSANAVDGFFATGSAIDFTARAWATGPGTVAALQRAGVSPVRIDAPSADAKQFDSEALWQQVSGTIQATDRVLIVRGASHQDATGDKGVGRDWLAQRLMEAGAAVDFVASYQRSAPVFDAGQLKRAQAAASDNSIWLFSSSEAVSNLKQALPEQNWAQARAVATHVRIAGAAKEAGFGQVTETRPTLADIVASIESNP